MKWHGLDQVETAAVAGNVALEDGASSIAGCIGDLVTAEQKILQCM